MRAAALGSALALAAGAAEAQCDVTAAACQTTPAIAPAAAPEAPSTAQARLEGPPGRAVRDCSVSAYLPPDPAAPRSPLDQPAPIDLTPLSLSDLKSGKTLDRATYALRVELTSGWSTLVQATLTNREAKPRAIALYCRYEPAG